VVHFGQGSLVFRIDSPFMSILWAFVDFHYIRTSIP